jgi:diadenosine tetraphosphate (Ap4A) HIT family hydrolase
MLSFRQCVRVYIGGLPTCPYCASAPEDAWILTKDVVALPHPKPLASFHTVVAPRRHVAAFYDLDVGEQRYIWDVISILRQRISATLKVEGFDIGFYDGPHGDPDAHAVVHLVPRIAGAKITLPSDIEWVVLDS